MATRSGHRVEDNNRNEAWAEDDDFTHAGDSYTVRVTALHPYKKYNDTDPNKRDELFCHIDYRNNTQGISGRFQNVWISSRNFGEAAGHLRRHSAYRTLRQLLVQRAAQVASPIFL